MKSEAERDELLDETYQLTKASNDLLQKRDARLELVETAINTLASEVRGCREDVSGYNGRLGQIETDITAIKQILADILTSQRNTERTLTGKNHSPAATTGEDAAASASAAGGSERT